MAESSTVLLRPGNRIMDSKKKLGFVLVPLILNTRVSRHLFSQPNIIGWEGNKFSGFEMAVVGMYYVVPISRACTAIYFGGNVALHGLITHCTLINFRKCGLHVFYLDHFL